MSVPTPSTVDFAGTPYSLEQTSTGVLEDVNDLSERVQLLRHDGKLSDATLRDYFGDKRFEQIAESNALEGSTLDVGETQLAVLRGVTITGHDPAFARDAQALNAALDRILTLASSPEPTGVEQVLEVHAQVLGERAGAGVLRSEPVRIAGSQHRPPKTWLQVMAAMEQWEQWSMANPSAPGLLRGIVLHTWLTQIHPFIDGNGRTARAVLNLELVRCGLPSVIIGRKDRNRYLDGLVESDVGGDLGPIAELIVERAEHALRDLEPAATRAQNYSAAAVRLRERQELQLSIWNDASSLLVSLLQASLVESFGDAGEVATRRYSDALSLEDFLLLCDQDPGGNSWLFRLDVRVPALQPVSLLLYTGFRNDRMRSATGVGPGPALFWSVPDPTGRRPWVHAGEASPGGVELTLELPMVDRWSVRKGQDVVRQTPSELVHAIVQDVERRLG